MVKFQKKSLSKDINSIMVHHYLMLKLMKSLINWTLIMMEKFLIQNLFQHQLIKKISCAIVDWKQLSNNLIMIIVEPLLLMSFRKFSLKEQEINSLIKKLIE